MARSSYIYVIGAEYGPEDMSTFTVKHEAQAFLRAAIDAGCVSPEDITICRFPDGGGGAQHYYTVDGFLT